MSRRAYIRLVLLGFAVGSLYALVTFIFERRA